MTKIKIYDGSAEVEVDRNQFTKDIAKEMRERGMSATARDVEKQLKLIDVGEQGEMNEIGQFANRRVVPPYDNPGYWPFDNRLKPNWPDNYKEEEWDDEKNPLFVPSDFEVPASWSPD